MRHFSVTEGNGEQCSRVNSLELLPHEGKLSGQRRGIFCYLYQTKIVVTTICKIMCTNGWNYNMK